MLLPTTHTVPFRGKPTAPRLGSFFGDPATRTGGRMIHPWGMLDPWEARVRAAPGRTRSRLLSVVSVRCATRGWPGVCRAHETPAHLRQWRRAVDVSPTAASHVRA